jgi:hypothetical protein
MKEHDNILLPLLEVMERLGHMTLTDMTKNPKELGQLQGQLLVGAIRLRVDVLRLHDR